MTLSPWTTRHRGNVPGQYFSTLWPVTVFCQHQLLNLSRAFTHTFNSANFAFISFTPKRPTPGGPWLDCSPGVGQVRCRQPRLHYYDRRHPFRKSREISAPRLMKK